VDLKAIGRRVRKLREEADEVQEDLAAAVGVTRPTIAGIEGGKDQGGLKTMVAIADHYKVPLDWLLCRDVPPGGPTVGKFIDRPDQIAWSNFWDSLTGPERMAVVSLLRIPRPQETG
jgi:putative transcriptional regulator